MDVHLRSWCILRASVLLVMAGVWIARDASPIAYAQSRIGPNDVVCETLMADYLLRPGKIGTATIDAAIELVASRGRHGYWKTVLQRFQETDVNDQASPSPNLLKILTKMLEVDGIARWLNEHPDELRQSAWQPTVILPAEVLDVLIARAKLADRQHRDAYLVAIVAAHDRRAKDFLTETLRGMANPKNNASTGGIPLGDLSSQFYAAVGLANLGERSGLAWLIDGPLGGSLWTVPHVKALGGDMLEGRLHALSDLTGTPYQPLEKWQAWWQGKPIGQHFEPKARVCLRYP